jgi:hypothetical protein
VSATTDLTAPNDTQTVYTVEHRGFFLTQACVSSHTNGVRLDHDGFGGIAVVGATDDTLCQSFNPDGVFLTSGLITCSIRAASTFGVGHFCRITGVLP